MPSDKPWNIATDMAINPVVAADLIKKRAKKVRCTCVRCGKINYLPAAGTDRSEPFLCEPCDDKYIAWANASNFLYREPLARFLKERPCRR